MSMSVRASQADNYGKEVVKQPCVHVEVCMGFHPVHHQAAQFCMNRAAPVGENSRSVVREAHVRAARSVGLLYDPVVVHAGRLTLRTSR